MTKVLKSIVATLKKVYSDDLDKRELTWKAPVPLTPTQAKQAMMQAGVSEYNEFRARFFDLFPWNCEILLAREGSVCVYVKGTHLPTRKQLHADEYTKQGEWTRIWWD